MTELDVNQLAKVSRLFEVLDAPGRHKLLALSRKLHVPAGTVIFREGDRGDEFFVVAKGSVRVTAADGEVQKELAVLGHGQFFGEMAILSGDVRTATVTAVEDVDLVGFPGHAVDALLREYPKARETLHKIGLLRAEDALEKLHS